jgi:predicted Zn-dependent protease
MSGRALPQDQYPQHGAGGALIDIPGSIERVLRLSHADACIVIGQHEASANVRWASNTVTTNGAVEKASLSIVSIIGQRVASVTRTHFPPDQIEAMVRESEAACRQRPDAQDYVPLIEGDGKVPADWGTAPAEAGIQALDALVPQLGGFFERARGSAVSTFGYAEHDASTVWLATSTGVRRRHSDRLGKIEITAKTPDFARSSWVGRATNDFRDVDVRTLFDGLEQRLRWSAHKIDLPAGQYEVLLEPSCTADLAIRAYDYMTRRDADEGRSPFSTPGGGTRIGERLFGTVTIHSDPDEQGIRTAPFHVGLDSSSAASVFDNGVPAVRTDWVRDGELRALVTPRYWAAKSGAPAPVLFINNLVVSGDGPTLEEMIAQTERALLITCFWYIRTVDPQTALETGLTRDGVFLVEHGKVVGAVNNFRWNMSPIAAFAQATQIGRTGMSLPREHDEFLRAKAPPMRIERFNMSSPSEAT